MVPAGRSIDMSPTCTFCVPSGYAFALSASAAGPASTAASAASAPPRLKGTGVFEPQALHALIRLQISASGTHLGVVRA